MLAKSVRKRGLLIALLLTVALVACSSDDDGGEGSGDSGSDDTYKIGYSASITGRLAFYEEPFLAGLELAIDQVNADGGIDGKYQVELDVRDSQSDPATTGTVVSELIADGAQFLIVPCDGDIAIAGSSLGQEEGIPMLSSCGQAVDFPERVGEYQFLTAYSSVDQGAAMGEFALDQGFTEAYFLTSNDIAFTDSLGETAKAAFVEGGGEVVGETTFRISQARYSAQATEIANADPEVLISAMFVPDSVSFLQELRANGYDGPVVTNDGNDAPILFQAGSATNNVFVATHANPEPGNEYEKFSRDYEEEYGEEPESVFVGLGGDAMRVISAAVTAAGSTDPSEVRDALANLENLNGVTGPITYADAPYAGVPIKDVVFKEAVDGEFVYVTRFYPEFVAE